jgi:hypothetical protein
MEGAFRERRERGGGKNPEIIALPKTPVRIFFTPLSGELRTSLIYRWLPKFRQPNPDL